MFYLLLEFCRWDIGQLVVAFQSRLVPFCIQYDPRNVGYYREQIDSSSRKGLDLVPTRGRRLPPKQVATEWLRQRHQISNR